MTEVLHTIIDVLAGRRNLPEHEADKLHEALTPGYTTPEPTAEELAAAQALLARANPTTTSAAGQAGTTAGASDSASGSQTVGESGAEGSAS